MGENMKFAIIALAAVVTIIPLSSFGNGGCTLNEVPVPGDPELIQGTNSADVIDCSTSSVRHDIYGGGGGDTLTGSNFDDFIAGGGGNDIISGGDGHDAIDGGANDDTIDGGPGNDVIFGGVGSAPASGVGCTLKIAFIALGSSYLTKGGSGDDTIYGGKGDDCIDAGSGEDIVHGEQGNDTLEGGNHSDILYGGADDDWIDGGWHSDTCIGGEGEDTFVNCELDDGLDPDCGDGTCDALGENSCNCPSDCGSPTANETTFCDDGLNNDCDSDTDCDDSECSTDPACTPSSDCNNDSTCDPGEDCDNCPNDCVGKSNGKPSGRFCCGDDTDQSAEGDGSICDDNY